MKSNKVERQKRPLQHLVGQQWQACATHGPANPNVWGCPECLRELRDQNRTLREALKVARDTVHEGSFPIGWNIDRLDEVLKPNKQLSEPCKVDPP